MVIWDVPSGSVEMARLNFDMMQGSSLQPGSPLRNSDYPYYNLCPGWLCSVPSVSVISPLEALNRLILPRINTRGASKRPIHFLVIYASGFVHRCGDHARSTVRAMRLPILRP